MKKLVLFILLSMVLSCGGSSPPNTTYTQSCNFIADSYLCEDYGPTLTEVKEECEAFKGTYSTSLCPTANRVGTCYFNRIEKALRLYSSSTPGKGWTTKTAQDNCNAGPFIGN